MEKKIFVQGQEYILASSLLAEERIRVLKHQDCFGIFDRYGDISSVQGSEEGVYFQGTRFLSHLEINLLGTRPLLLNSSVRHDNLRLNIYLTNPDLQFQGEFIPRGAINIMREIYLKEDGLFEKLVIWNYSNKPVALPLEFRFDSDFTDIFEVRGIRREKRGELVISTHGNEQLNFEYWGLDRVRRTTQISFERPPDRVSGRDIYFEFLIAPKSEETIFGAYEFSVNAKKDRKRNVKDDYISDFENREKEIQIIKNQSCIITTSNDQFNSWLNRSEYDLIMLLSNTEKGLYPYAGVPWFSTTFGRDGIITALQTIWLNDNIARGVLSFLAGTQASTFEAENDAEPGKILHEARNGEMANLNEIPFRRYYGSVDSTPLFLVLAGEYFKKTRDMDFMSSLSPCFKLALEWLKKFGDRDNDGFIEYNRQSERGLINQGWKDSHDSVFHRNGDFAEGPVALCEAQGYLYQAKTNMAFIAQSFGESDFATQLLAEADVLKNRFHESFWCDSRGTYALALDGNKQKCEVISSNSGHCLYSGIIHELQARYVADVLMNDLSFSGWGIRTIAKGEALYNPMSYHNGSIWPHDNALIAMGLARYRRKDDVLRLINGMFEVSQFMELNRLPELFCGFSRRSGEKPTLYPLSCAPQAWAAGTVYMMLQACLGLEVRAWDKSIIFDYPVLPESLKWVQIKNLRVGPYGSIDLEIVRHEYDVSVNVIRRVGDITVIVKK